MGGGVIYFAVSFVLFRGRFLLYNDVAKSSPRLVKASPLFLWQDSCVGWCDCPPLCVLLLCIRAFMFL